MMIDYRSFSLWTYISSQIAWSSKTFGPPRGTKGVIDHIKKEVLEVESNPSDITEWIDLIILSLDGAWREGFTPEQIITALQAKYEINIRRKWPDWRESNPEKAIEHIKEA